MSESQRSKAAAKSRCGLCGRTKNLMRTPCCGNWVCDDHHKYVLFSYARNSCARNHDRYTLCSFHRQNNHKGNWKNCRQCREAFGTEMYVWFGTNEYNFEVLEDPPSYQPTQCDQCGVVIKLGTDGHSVGPRGTLCERCTEAERDGATPAARPKRPAPPRPPKVALPVNSNPRAIEIILSAQAQKHWRLQPTVKATEPPAHWLGQWRVDLARKPDRTRAALVTNVATLYTFVFPFKELGRSAAFEQLFHLRLGFALTDAPGLAAWKNAPLVFASGNPRMAIGSMNNMRQHLAWRTETPACEPMQDDEDWINKTPFLSLPGFFPDKAFARRLADSNSTQSP